MTATPGSSKDAKHTVDDLAVALPYNRRPRRIAFPLAVLIGTHAAGLVILFVVKNHFDISRLAELFGIPVSVGYNTLIFVIQAHAVCACMNILTTFTNSRDIYLHSALLHRSQ